MSRLLRLAVFLLPQSARARYTEEWAADSRDAAELGLEASAVTRGALLFAITYQRGGEVGGLEPSMIASRRIQRGIAFVLCGLVAVFALALGGAASDGVSSVPAVAFLQVLGLAVRTAVAVAGIGGGVIVILTGALLGGARSPVALFAAVGLAVGCVLPFTQAWLGGVAIAAGVILVVLALGVLGVVVLAARRAATEHAVGGRIGRAAVVGFVVVLLTIALGAVDALVWMPLTLAPGFGLANIYATIRPELWYSLTVVILWAAIWIAVAVIGLRLARHAVRSSIVVTLTLAIVSAVVFFQWWAAFGIGSAVSDALPPFSGGQSDFWPYYAFVGQAALVAVILRTVSPARLSVAQAFVTD